MIPQLEESGASQGGKKAPESAGGNPSEEPAIGRYIVWLDAKTPDQISFAINGQGPVPEVQTSLQIEIESTVSILRLALSNDEKRFKSYLSKLLGLAQAGLVGDGAQPIPARLNLIELRKHAVEELGPTVKNHYLRTLLVRASIACAGLLTLAAAWYAASKRFLHWLPLSPINYLILLAGCMAGVWVSFGIRNTNIQFHQLHNLEDDYMAPIYRLVFAGVLTLSLALLFATGMVEIKLGPFAAGSFETNGKIALLIGLLCGFSERSLASKVIAKATDILSFDKQR